MSLIRVNHQSIHQVADSIERYCKVHDMEMATADHAVKSLPGQGWEGRDADIFSGRWEEVDGKASISVRFKKSMEEYAKALRACAEIYQTAQEDSYDEAARLPTFLAW